jgi:dipeptidyl aminopeptidase/acylaminoacyl peptidase
MRPRLFTVRNAILLIFAAVILGGLVQWVRDGMPLPGSGVPSTAGKITFVSNRGDHPDLWMMNGTDGSGAVALTDDGAEDRRPRFSPNGNEIVFTSAGRAGVNPQVFLMDAVPKRRPIPLTNTSSSKSAPQFESKDTVVYLDAGKLAEYNVSTQDTHAVFPPPDLKRTLDDFVSAGGIEAFVPIASERFAMVMNTEQGQVLLLFQHDELNADSLLLAILGSAEHIRLAPIADGGFAAAFENGAPLAHAALLLDRKALEAGAKPPAPNLPIPKGTNALALFDQGGTVKGALQLPFPIDDLAVTPDGKSLVMASERTDTPMGLVVATPGQQQPPVQLASLPAREPVVSPDGQSIAFVSGKDIYVVPTAGGEPKNLTNGAGDNSAPNWSPAKPEKK